jgi:hypothetical protein
MIVFAAIVAVEVLLTTTSEKLYRFGIVPVPLVVDVVGFTVPVPSVVAVIGPTLAVPSVVAVAGFTVPLPSVVAVIGPTVPVPSPVTTTGLVVIATLTVPFVVLTAVIGAFVTLRLPATELNPVVVSGAPTTAFAGRGFGNVYVATLPAHVTFVAVPSDCGANATVTTPDVVFTEVMVAFVRL